MGRYDKIRYWDGSNWRQPSQVKYWNGTSWVDLGTNESSNTKSLYIRNGNTWQRKTLNRTYHPVDHYLQYDGGAITSLPDGYQFYNAEYSFVVRADAIGNYMLYESANSTSSPNTYVRFGLYNRNNIFYCYTTSSRAGSSAEVNTINKGTMSAGVSYKCTIKSNGTLTVLNYSTGVEWSVSGSLSTFYNYSCTCGMFAGVSVSGRNLYGKIWSASLQGCKANTSINSVEYNLNSSAGGAKTLAITKSTSTGGVSAISPTHHGTIYDPSYVTWE